MAVPLTVGIAGQYTLIAVIGGVAVTIVLILLVVICVCGEKKSRQNGTENHAEENQKAENADLIRNGGVGTDNVRIDVDTGVVPLANGQATYDNNISGSLKVSPGSPLQTHRKLPAPPPEGTLAASLLPKEEDDDYDHLNRNDRKKSTKDRQLNYDHVAIDSDGQFQIIEGKENLVPDNYYAEVKTENIYAGVKDDENDIDNDDYARVQGASKEKDTVTTTAPSNMLLGDLIDDTYARVKDESKDASHGSSKDVYPYAKVKDVPHATIDKSSTQGMSIDFDPYAVVKDDPYSKVKDKDISKGVIKETDVDDPYNKVLDDCDSEKSFDPYNRVKDDPYSRVKGDDPYNKVKGDDPYNKVKGDDDPYNKVNGDDDPYNKVSGDSELGDDPSEDLASGGGIEDHYSKVDPNRKQNNVTRIDVNRQEIGNVLSEPSIPNSNDEYAVVVKNTNDKGAGFSVVSDVPTRSNLTSSTGDEIDPYTLPPEPPRRYGSEEIRDFALPPVSTPPRNSPRNSREIPSTVSPPTQPVVTSTQAVAASPAAVEPAKKKEPPYSKLTARESMASINARRALNTYETVAETENFYATVEGGSGDGVITPQVVAASTSSQKRTSQLNEDYAEIGATGVANGNIPAPPSLDSLHSMTKINPNGFRSSQDEDDMIDKRYESVDHPRSPVSNPRLSANMTGARISGNSEFNHPNVHTQFGAPSSVQPSLGASGITDVVLSPNYQTVKDFIPEDSDMDPNYESVEEAKAKVNYESSEMKDAMMDRKKRTHVYEEVKPSPESTQVKTRVLRSHMYEDIDEVKEQKKEIKRKSEEDDVVWKRRSDIESEKL